MEHAGTDNTADRLLECDVHIHGYAVLRFLRVEDLAAAEGKLRDALTSSGLRVDDVTFSFSRFGLAVEDAEEDLSSTERPL